MNYSVILLAAGRGKRMNLGYNKLLFSLEGKPIVALSAKHFFQDPHCTEIIYVTNSDEQVTMKNLLEEHQVFDTRCKLISGGDERQYSVYNGLKHVQNEIVLVHDAARPFITKNLITSLISDANTHGCAIPGVKVKDTIKIVKDELVDKTLNRNLLFSVQTPQACLTGILKKAHQLAKDDQLLGTDEAMLIEHFQLSSVKITEGSYENIKLTTKDDLLIANQLYKKYFS